MRVVGVRVPRQVHAAAVIMTEGAQLSFRLALPEPRGLARRSCSGVCTRCGSHEGPDFRVLHFARHVRQWAQCALHERSLPGSLCSDREGADARSACFGLQPQAQAQPS